MIKKNKNIILYLILPLASFLISITVSLFLDVDKTQSIMIGILIAILVSTVEINLNHKDHSAINTDEHRNFNESLKDVTIANRILNNYSKIKHPYFKHAAHEKLLEFEVTNANLFNSYNKTYPGAPDTFGVPGIKMTKTNGIIQAVSSVKDYWNYDDGFAKPYAEANYEVVETKNVIIERVFCLNPDFLDYIIAAMKEQTEKRIKCFYIIPEKCMAINKDYFSEDFLIQDKVLVTRIVCDSHAFSRDNFEEITMDPSIVMEKQKIFDVLKQSATLFDLEKSEEEIRKVYKQ